MPEFVVKSENSVSPLYNWYDILLVSILDYGRFFNPRRQASQEGVANNTLGVTIDVSGPEQGLIGNLGKFLMLELSHVVDNYSQVFALKSRSENVL